MMKRKILLVLTGGTIGSIEKDGIVNVNPDGSIGILSAFRQMESSVSGEVDFLCVQPLNLLSENLNPNDWLVMADAVREGVGEHADVSGVILLHGSDTLSYTSAAMDCLCNNLPVPVVLTAANYPFADIRSNGPANLAAAVRFIREMNQSRETGVYTIYKNNQNQIMVYHASCICEADALTDQYQAWGGAFGEMTGTGLIRNAVLPNPIVWNVEETAFGEVCMLPSYPGMRYDYFEPGTDCAAVLIMLYHSATASVVGSATSLVDAIRRWKSRGLTCYLCGFTNQESYAYETTKELLDAGGIPVPALTKETAYARLWLSCHGINNIFTKSRKMS